MRLHCAVAGRGHPIVFLHGFPDFWFSWRKQIPAVVAAGYRAIAPDLRGYNLSDKPPGVSGYHLDELAEDVAAMARWAGEPVTLVGHDWGGVIAWRVAERWPELAARLVIINSPKVERYVRALFNPKQLVKSWYVMFFQIPVLPEAVMQVIGVGPAKGLFGAATRRADASSRAAADRYRAAFPRATSWRPPINYYRAAARPRRSAARGRSPIDHPTLVLWGTGDRALETGLADPGGDISATIELIDDAGHWVHIRKAEVVNERLLRFLAETGAEVSAAPDPA